MGTAGAHGLMGMSCSAVGTMDIVTRTKKIARKSMLNWNLLKWNLLNWARQEAGYPTKTKKTK